jgi:hypothetical protein
MHIQQSAHQMFKDLNILYVYTSYKQTKIFIMNSS